MMMKSAHCVKEGGGEKGVMGRLVHTGLSSSGHFFLLPIATDLALRCNMQRRVDVLWVCQAPILQGVAATPITVMADAEVEDQAPAANLVP
jgi:hypothetical protein